MTDVFAPKGEVRVTRKGAARPRHGHPWIYRTDLASDGPSEPGFVTVIDPTGKRLGVAMYSPHSEIRIRMLTRGEPCDRDLFAARLREAWERRGRLLPTAEAFRWVHGEADLLPGIFIDRYADCVTLQTTCAGADRLEPELVPLIVAQCAPRAVVIRDDTNGRHREGLASRVEVVHGEAPVRAAYREGSVRLEVDLLEDQKTGGYLDQAQNHLLAGRYARGDALDCFTYHGGFALQMAAAGARVTAIDQSAAALSRARENAARNNLSIEWVEANVFDHLGALRSRGVSFDTIVLDPPAFASGRPSLDAAARAYKEINLRAMTLLRPGGVLITCSCSGRMRPEHFDDILAQAARDARRSVHLVERAAAGPDHPVLLGVPETDYLKCRVLLMVG